MDKNNIVTFDCGFPALYSCSHNNKYTVSERHRMTLIDTFRVSLNPFEYWMVMTLYVNYSYMYGINVASFVVRNTVRVNLSFSLIN
jgi:hypothetical protein